MFCQWANLRIWRWRRIVPQSRGRGPMQMQPETKQPAQPPQKLTQQRGQKLAKRKWARRQKLQKLLPYLQLTLPPSNWWRAPQQWWCFPCFLPLNCPSLIPLDHLFYLPRYLLCKNPHHLWHSSNYIYCPGLWDPIGECGDSSTFWWMTCFNESERRGDQILRFGLWWTQ